MASKETNHHSSSEQPELSKHDVGWRRIVRNFAPSWFSVTMGTGIVAVLLNSLPYNGIWLYWISVVIFALNVLLFGIGCIITLLRYVLYPEILPVVVMHPVQSMFLGTFPMGLSTIIDMVCYVCVPAWGEWTRNFAWGLWIFDAVVSVVTTLTPPLLITIRGNEAPLSSFTASWFLPIASSIVASSTGAFVADVVTNPQHALWTIIVSYALWGMGMSLAMMVMVVYFQRLALHKLPPKAVIVSVFLPLGPLGQGAFVILKLGEIANRIFPETNTLHPSAGPTFYTIGFLISLILWAFGLVWLVFAIASLLRCRSFPFNMGWWAFVFPLGVYANSTCQMGVEMPSAFFNVLGTILSLCVLILWIAVSIPTIMGVLSGKLFVEPALADLKAKEEAKKRSNLA
ncbi:hypothetical protein MW887_005538 [Aspergillus wentii]|nr:hypothetical protein MW887_005538 [Aspergillus wentii]